MAWSSRPARKRMEARLESLGLEVRHSGQCPDCGRTIELYTETVPDPIVPSHISVATCAECGARWAITKI